VALVATAQFMANDFSLTVKTALATVLFMMFGLCYSLMNCAYGAMVPAITKNPNERAQLAAWRQGGATVGLLLCTVGFMPIQALFVTSPHWLSGGRAGVRYRRPVLHVVVLQRGERTLRRAYARSP
jgi:GPH family glycoside/pentoside/hexuronide:cation symporter